MDSSVITDVKTIYSDETIAILNDVRITELLGYCHGLRFSAGLKKADNLYLMSQVLKMYARATKRRIKSKQQRAKKRGVSNGQ